MARQLYVRHFGYRLLSVNNITLTPTQPFSFKECLFFLNRNENECLFSTENDQLTRAIDTGNRLLPVTVSSQGSELRIDLPEDTSEEEHQIITDYVRHWLDTDRDLIPFYRILNQTSKMTSLASDYEGLRLIGIPDVFEALCWSIIGQQINLAFAYKLKKRLVEAYGASCEWQGKTLHHFPKPKDLMVLDEEFLRGQQFSRSKIKYLRNVSEAFVKDGLSKESLAEVPDFKSRQEMLTQIKGIGEWSANYALMKTFHQPEAIPFGDTGLTQALFNLGIISDRKDRQSIEKFFKSVKGWESYTSFYLWRSLS